MIHQGRFDKPIDSNRDVSLGFIKQNYRYVAQRVESHIVELKLTVSATVEGKAEASWYTRETGIHSLMASNTVSHIRVKNILSCCSPWILGESGTFL